MSKGAAPCLTPVPIGPIFQVYLSVYSVAQYKDKYFVYITEFLDIVIRKN